MLTEELSLFRGHLTDGSEALYGVRPHLVNMLSSVPSCSPHPNIVYIAPRHLF